MSTERNLDGQIKQALENLQAKYDGLSWEVFEQRLEQSDSDTSPNGADAAGAGPSFDEVIAGKLGPIEVPITACDWSLMEKMIEADETAEVIENEAFVDNLLTEKLENFQVAYQPQHWQMMANRLEEEFFVRYHILRCKIAETALMAFILFTIARFAPALQGTMDNPAAPALPSATWPTAPASTPFLPQNISPTGSQTAPIAQAQTAKKSSITVFNGPLATIRAARFSKGKAAGNVGLIASTDETFGGGNFPSIKLPQLGFKSLKSSQLPSSLLENILEKRFLRASLRTPGMDNRNTLMLASLDGFVEKPKYAWEVPQLLPKGAFFNKDWAFRISAFTTTDVAFVLTPPTKFSMYDTLISAGYDTTLASGYGGGIAVHFKKHKWEVQTGATYSFKRFMPNTPAVFVETVNYILRREEEEFEGVQLNVLQIPVNVNYHFKDQGKWRVYGSVGAAGHLIATTSNQGKEYASPTSATFAILPPSTNATAPSGKEIATVFPAPISEEPEAIASKTEAKRYQDGFLEGGHFRSNFYLTANIGLGLERYVSPRWSIFLQPNYQHQFLTNGVGANSERFYNFSIQFGTKVGLK
ncbi:MAG: hypothetical protein IT258_06430 [Saprospiraceae bacterium]|nr:hypothetical protein [Saprospiraceae bacterium]